MVEKYPTKIHEFVDRARKSLICNQYCPRTYAELMDKYIVWGDGRVSSMYNEGEIPLIPRKLIKEFNERYDKKVGVLPKYIPVRKRKVSDKDMERLTEALRKRIEDTHHHILSASEIGGPLRTILLEIYTDNKRSPIIQRNKELIEEINSRWHKAIDEVVESMDNILMGLCENPIEEVKRLREKEW